MRQVVQATPSSGGGSRGGGGGGEGEGGGGGGSLFTIGVAGEDLLRPWRARRRDDD